MKIAIIGTGLYSLGVLANLKYDEVSLWTENKDIVTEYKKTKKLDSIIKGVKYNKNIHFDTSYQNVLENAKIVFLMTSSAYIESVADEIKKYINKNTIVIVGTKGILTDGVLISDMLKKTLPTKKILFIAGPTFAVDLIKNEPCGFNVAGDQELCVKIKEIFKDNIYLKYTEDVIGLEICSSIKNVFAIGSGIIEGLKYHESTLNLYITRLIKEMERITRRLDCYKETIYDLAGLGDIMLTCSSKKSRNYTFGKLLASKKIKDMKRHLADNTCEGYYTLDSINDLFNKKKINFPIVNALYEIVFHDEAPHKLIDSLLLPDKNLKKR